MIINVQENLCWICGGIDELTQHHVLPKHLHPIKNITVPVCNKCHQEKINATDIAGLYAFAYRIEQTNLDASRAIKKLIIAIENNALISAKVKK